MIPSRGGEFGACSVEFNPDSIYEEMDGGDNSVETYCVPQKLPVQKYSLPRAKVLFDKEKLPSFYANPWSFFRMAIWEKVWVIVHGYLPWTWASVERDRLSVKSYFYKKVKYFLLAYRGILAKQCGSLCAVK